MADACGVCACATWMQGVAPSQSAHRECCFPGRYVLAFRRACPAWPSRAQTAYSSNGSATGPCISDRTAAGSLASHDRRAVSCERFAQRGGFPIALGTSAIRAHPAFHLRASSVSRNSRCAGRRRARIALDRPADLHFASDPRILSTDNRPDRAWRRRARHRRQWWSRNHAKPIIR